ncbi:hypothetical protein WA158_008020 [Blastocystis sp. Blastoise]
MRPILLKGHERSITFLKYNKEGDIFFSCGKDKEPTLWCAENGQRIGTYIGHNGSIWHIDVTSDSKYCITASGDQTCKIWEVQTGKCLCTLDHKQPVRVVGISEDDKRFFTCVDAFAGESAKILIWDIPEDIRTITTPTTVISELGFLNESHHINDAIWTPANEGILVAGQDGYVRCFNPITGEIMREVKAHNNSVNSVALSKDGLFFLTASTDATAKLFETFSFEHVYTYKTDRPLNSGAISPILDQVVVVGGTEARDVTTSKNVNMETLFFSLPLQEEIGRVKGHFGTMNCIAFNPDGRSFITGGEDGFIRLHFFDKNYFEQDKLAEKELRYIDSLARKQEEKRKQLLE